MQLVAFEPLVTGFWCFLFRSAKMLDHAGGLADLVLLQNCTSFSKRGWVCHRRPRRNDGRIVVRANADVDGHAAQEPLKSTLAELEDASRFVRVLGSYPRAVLTPSAPAAEDAGENGE